MNVLALILTFKIVATVLVWCIPLLLFPSWLLEQSGLPSQEINMFARMLGWAYLSLCVGYCVGLSDEIQGKRNMLVVCVGLVSNGGGCLYLLYYGFSGTWTHWAVPLQVMLWGSAIAAGLITAGLYVFGFKSTNRSRKIE